MMTTERERSKGTKDEHGVQAPPLRGFMDDLMVTRTTQMHTRWVLTSLEDTVTWEHMEFKPQKSRCLVLKKGIISQKFKMKVQSDDIPTIVNNQQTIAIQRNSFLQ